MSTPKSVSPPASDEEKARGLVSRRVDIRQRDIAIRVLMGTKLVHNWAMGELKFLGVDPESPVGKSFLEDKTHKLAETIIDNRA